MAGSVAPLFLGVLLILSAQLASAAPCKYPSFDVCFALDATASAYRNPAVEPPSFPGKGDYSLVAEIMGNVADALDPKTPLAGGTPNSRIVGIWFEAKGKLSYVLDRKSLFFPTHGLGFGKISYNSYPSDAGHAPSDFPGPLSKDCAKFNSKGLCLYGKPDAVTDFQAAIKACTKILTSRADKSRKAAIVLATDGYVNYKPKQSSPDPVVATKNAVAAAKKAGITFITVDVGGFDRTGSINGNIPFLKQLASGPKFFVGLNYVAGSLQLVPTVLFNNLLKGDKCTPKPPVCKITEYGPASGKLYPKHLLHISGRATTTTSGITNTVIDNPLENLNGGPTAGIGPGEQLTGSSKGFHNNYLLYVAPSTVRKTTKAVVKFVATDALGQNCLLARKVQLLPKANNVLPTCRITKVTGLKNGAVTSLKPITVHLEARSANKSTNIFFFDFIKYLGGSYPDEFGQKQGHVSKVLANSGGMKRATASVVLQFTPEYDCYVHGGFAPPPCPQQATFIFRDSSFGVCEVSTAFNVNPGPGDIAESG